MEDTFGRTINYLRLSITDRCNLRCRYCMPESGVQDRSHSEILCYEEMLRIVSAASDLGVRKVRVTGGEPLVRKGVINFLGELSQVPGIQEIALTSNGQRLKECADELRSAGVKLLNISLDSLQADTYAEITRGGALTKVLQGLDAAEDAGLKIKLNMVVMRGLNDGEIGAFAELSRTRPWAIRYIEYMPTIREADWQSRLVSGEEILNQLRQKYSLESLSTRRFCGPAKPYQISGALGTIGIITPMSEHFCNSCNRIRVTSTGKVKSCLLSDQAIDLKPALQQNDETLRIALQQVIFSKPSQHEMADQEIKTQPFSMSSIGG